MRASVLWRRGLCSGRRAGSRAFLDSELPAVVDLFRDHACATTGELNSPRDLGGLLREIGEQPDEATLERLFALADTDGSGGIDLDEFLRASDQLLGSNPARCILVVGGPGSGKGVLCDRLVAECSVAHISSGDMLREEVAARTPLGQQVEGIMRRGELVSSELMVTLLRRRMRQPEFAGRRLLLDGFPRSTQNAIDFGVQCGKPELALHLTCDEETMIERILSRARKQAEAGRGRADDNVETARERIKVFKASGASTMAWLRESKVPIIELDASGTPDEVWRQLLAIGRLMRSAVAIG